MNQEKIRKAFNKKMFMTVEKVLPIMDGGYLLILLYFSENIWHTGILTLSITAFNFLWGKFYDSNEVRHELIRASFNVPVFILLYYYSGAGAPVWLYGLTTVIHCSLSIGNKRLQLFLNILYPCTIAFAGYLAGVDISVLIPVVFILIILSALFILLHGLLLSQNQEIIEQKSVLEIKNKEVELEIKKSEHLLLNILPKETAEELKEFGSANPKSYEMASVLFTDFKGFTIISEELTPKTLVHELNYCFNAFDDIVGKYNLEKIKTIGDAYMCAGGIPIPNKTNAIDAVNAAIEMQQFINEWEKDKISKGELAWELRIGIHTGEIVSGVVGKTKFTYDIWGDTVNLAARMESSCEAGKINISETTYQLVKDSFKCTYRGKLKVKNKGEVSMYFVEKSERKTRYNNL